MLTTFPDLPHDELTRVLRYDSETGEFTWKVALSNRIRVGDEAGTITAKGYFVITLYGHTYYGHHLAWFYVHGKWPIGDPWFVDFDKTNLALRNIRFDNRLYSRLPNAVASRRTRAKKAREWLTRAKQDEHRASPIPEIAHNVSLRKWYIRLPGHPNCVIGTAATFEEAAQKFFARTRAIDFVRQDTPPVPRETDLQTVAGNDSSVNFLEVHAWIAYDPATGAFYRRARHTRAMDPRYAPSEAAHALAEGQRADHLNTNRSPVITFFGRDYSAASMAVFMRTRKWPKRRAVKHRDGDKTNNAWANLEVLE